MVRGVSDVDVRSGWGRDPESKGTQGQRGPRIGKMRLAEVRSH